MIFSFWASSSDMKSSGYFSKKAPGAKDFATNTPVPEISLKINIIKDTTSNGSLTINDN